MAYINVRLVTSPRDANAFAKFMCKIAENMPTALEIISNGTNRRSRDGTHVLRYMEIDFNTDDFERSGLNN